MKTVAPMRPRNLRLSHGGDTFEVRIAYGDSDRLSISVHPDLRVTVSAPLRSDVDLIHRRIQARLGWISRQRELFRQNQPLPVKRRYIGGETHPYLGRQYRLRIRVVPGTHPQVKLQGGYFQVSASHHLRGPRVRELMVEWYAMRSRQVLGAKCADWFNRCKSSGIPEPRLRMRTMKKRWGSCTPTGAILLNPELVKMPVQCIDYVIVHELCHLKVLRHSPGFYRLLSRYLPDWRTRKERLDRIQLPKP